MSKLDNVGHYDKNTGEELGFEIIECITKEDKKNKWKNIFYNLENNSNKLTLEEIEELLNRENISHIRLNKFERYHQSNDALDLELFEKGITMKAFYYFKFLVSKHCGTTYTLQFKNNINIINDSQVSESINISVSLWRKIKKELLDLNLIKIINFENKKYYKINPCYVGKKKILSPHTYHAFRDDIIKHKLISEIQRLWWDKFMLEEYLIIYNVQLEKNQSQTLEK